MALYRLAPQVRVVVVRYAGKQEARDAALDLLGGRMGRVVEPKAGPLLVDHELLATIAIQSHRGPPNLSHRLRHSLVIGRPSAGHPRTHLERLGAKVRSVQ